MSSSILAKKRILVIGDIMLDVYINADVKRISPEAPVPVLEYKSTNSMVGAAANVAKNIVSLESDATLVSMIGADMQGRDLISYIGKIPNVVPYLKISENRITTVKTRYLCQNHQMFRLDREDISPISDKMAESLISIIKNEIPHNDAILISDYAKGLISGKLAENISELIGKSSIPIIVDSKTKDYEIYRGATLITPNTIELHKATGIDTIHDAAYFLMDTYGIKNILVTQGSEGMTLFDDGVPYHIAAETTGVVDVTGAGDTVAAVMAIGLANGVDIKKSMELANDAAGIVVRKPGVASVTKKELSWKPTLH